jgi:hypothetical protein
MERRFEMPTPPLPDIDIGKPLEKGGDSSRTVISEFTPDDEDLYLIGFRKNLIDDD